MNKLFYFIWNIGFIESDIDSIILSDETLLEVKWLNHPYKDRFFADPFILSITDQFIYVLVEEFVFSEKKGIISKLKIDKNYNLVGREIICEQSFHQSYPFILKNGDYVNVIPEASQSGCLFMYQYDSVKKILINQKRIINEPLLDASFIYYDNYWWVFATKRGINANKELFIYFSHSIDGDYKFHPSNPVIIDSSSARPAGNLVVVNDNIYRLVQVCNRTYGEFVRVYRVVNLNLQNFEEVFVKELRLNSSVYNQGFHTLNGQDNICVVDGLKRQFSPLNRLVNELKYYLNHGKE